MMKKRFKDPLSIRFVKNQAKVYDHTDFISFPNSKEIIVDLDKHGGLLSLEILDYEEVTKNGKKV